MSNIFSLIKLNETRTLEKETKEFLSARMKQSKFEKKKVIHRENDLCDKIFIIKKGLVRGVYQIKETEITSWISTDNEIFTSISGFFSQTPSKERIEALEDTYVDYLEYKDLKEALNKFPDFTFLYYTLLEEYYEHSENRSIISKIPIAQDRLFYFMQHYNHEIIKRAPKKTLASFLNMRHETLSRLIKKYKESSKNHF